MSDEEDMAWGEQARIAIEQEANLSQGRWENPKIDPRSAAGPKYMRCLPEDEDSGSMRRSPSDRTTFLGRSLHQHNRRKGLHGCKAMPSHHDCQVSVDDSQETACMDSRDNASQRCRSNNSSCSSSSMRMNDASKGFKGAARHRRRQQQQGCQLQDGFSQPDYRLQGSHSRSRRQWQNSQQHSMHGMHSTHDMHSMHGSREHSSKVHSAHSSWAPSMHSSRQGSSPRCSLDSTMHSMQSVRHRCQESVYSSNCCGERHASDVDCQHASQMPVHASKQHATREHLRMLRCTGLPGMLKAVPRGTLARGVMHSTNRAGLIQTRVAPAFGSSRLAERGHIRRAGFVWHMLHAKPMHQMHSKTVSARQGVYTARLTKSSPHLSRLVYC